MIGLTSKYIFLNIDISLFLSSQSDCSFFAIMVSLLSSTSQLVIFSSFLCIASVIEAIYSLQVDQSYATFILSLVLGLWKNPSLFPFMSNLLTAIFPFRIYFSTSSVCSVLSILYSSSYKTCAIITLGCFKCISFDFSLAMKSVIKKLF